LFGDGFQALPGQPAGGGGDFAGGVDFDAEVVHPGGLARDALEQDELERRLGDGEVGVAGAALSGLGAQQPGVEGDRGLQVGDAEGELDTGHDGCSSHGRQGGDSD
jgi:hypothetical protein